MKKAFITGITGQDGSYLAELLLSKGYEVYGLIRRSSSFNTRRIEHLRIPSVDAGDTKQLSKKFGDNLYLAYGDLLDGSSLSNLLQEIQPDEIYNLGAQSHVQVSFEQPEFTNNVNAMGTIRLLEAARKIPNVKIYQASSSEMFGNSISPQNETTPFDPCSPYAISKVSAFWSVKNYRDSFGMFACNGILFNHEGGRRGETFVTRKITRAATRIKLGLQDKIVLGNLDAKRDWGYAKEYVEMMHLMLQQDQPEDYVIATGETHSVKEFLEETFDCLNLDPYQYLQVDERYFRPKEVNLLLGDSSKAKKILNWEPKVKFHQLVKLMVDHDLEVAKQEKILFESGEKHILI